MGYVVEWLLASDEPWTRYGTLVDLLGRPELSPEVQCARADMLAHPQVQTMIGRAAAWPEPPVKRHNDAGHPIYALSTLADFGVRASDPGVAAAIAPVLNHQSPEGAFQSVVNIAQAFGGSGEAQWAWLLCDAPTLLHSLLAMGLADDPRVKRAVDHLAGQADDNGWRCRCAPELGRFRGPGRKADPCPIANVYALKALGLLPHLVDGPAVRAGAEMLLAHWAHQLAPKVYMFGIGTDYHKLKYPFVWYDILHVVEVLRRLPWTHADPRFQEMVAAVAAQADGAGRYTASSMYQAWKGWSFADKKHPSPWLTFLAVRAVGRAQMGGE